MAHSCSKSIGVPIKGGQLRRCTSHYQAVYSEGIKHPVRKSEESMLPFERLTVGTGS